MCRTGFSSLSLSLTHTHTHTLQGPTDSDLSTRDVANTAAVCPNWAGYKESPIGEVFVNPPCRMGELRVTRGNSIYSGYDTGGGYDFTSPVYDFTSPAVDWQGVCVRGVCAICHDGERRCTSVGITPADGIRHGIPQVRL